MTDHPEKDLEMRARALLERIPGYRGYRLKEDRRDADRRVREAVADAYQAELLRVERVGRAVANARRLDEIAAVERANQAIRHYIDRVRTQSSGYGGLFSERSVDGVALDQLRLFDEGLLAGVEELQPTIAALESAAAANQPLAQAAAAISHVIDQQIVTLNTRQHVVDSGLAVSDADALAALRPAQESTPRPFFGARPGDAMSILGDNHLVDAVIVVNGRPDNFEIYRIGKDPDDWLFVGRDPRVDVLRLAPATATAVDLNIAERSLQQRSAGTGDGELLTRAGTGDLRAVRYALLEEPSDPETQGVVIDWDGERQAFVGHPVDGMDIELYRRTTATS